MYQANINQRKAGVTILISNEVDFRAKIVIGRKKMISQRQRDQFIRNI